MRKTIVGILFFVLSLWSASTYAHDSKQLTAETIAARQKFLGLDNVDPNTGAVRSDRVLLSWIGVSSFVAAFKGHVVILDAYVGRAGGFASAPWPGIRYVGATVEELAAVKPELILFGHAHFDHAGDFPQLVRANPPAGLAGTAEHCRDIQNEVSDVSFRCISMFPEHADLGSVAELPKDVLPGVGITAIKQPHSSAPPDPVADPPFPFNSPICKTTPGLAFSQYPVQPDDPLSWDFQTAGPPSGIIAVAWQIRVGKFPHWLTVRPDGQVLFVSLWDSNAVAAIDINTRKVLTNIQFPRGSGPKRILVAPKAGSQTLQ